MQEVKGCFDFSQVSNASYCSPFQIISFKISNLFYKDSCINVYSRN